MSFHQKLRNFYTQILNFIRTLNLFPSSPPSVDEYCLKTERISTFVYIILLIIGCLVLLVYVARETVTQTITIQSPSFDRYQTLYDKHGEKLSCPCSTITNQYQDFLSIDPVFHPVCTSDFVGDDWMNYKYSSNSSLAYYDFRPRMAATSHLLASYCILANNTIYNALIAFNSTEMISIELLSENLFHAKIQQSMDAYIQPMTKIFSYDLDSIRTTTKANFIMTGLSTNSLVVFDASSFEVISNDIGYNSCFCSASATCVDNAWIYSHNVTQFYYLYMVPGFYVGCYPDDALRKSTLECYFNQSCVDTFKFYLGTGQTFATKALDPNPISGYDITTPIDDIITDVMVDYWLANDSFEIYYEKCRPSSCYYTLITRTPFIVILTTLIGLYGGLAKVLRIIVPLIIRFVRRRKQLQASQPNLKARITNIIQKAKEALQNLNLFRSAEVSENDDDGHQLKNELISTRLFICLLFISLVILLVYTSRVRVTHTVTVNSPSSAVYSNLYEKYADTLTCPCTNIAIDQQEFILLTPTFHQVCDSAFVDPRWVLGIDIAASLGYIYFRDFRSRGSPAFATLISLCSLGKTSVANALTDFNSTAFISKDVLPEKILIAQMNAIIDSYITTLTYNFVHSFQIIRDTTQTNGLVSATLSSISFTLLVNSNVNGNGSIGTVATRYQSYPKSKCSCRTSVTCIQQMAVYTTDGSNQPVYPIPGLFIGCYAFEAMLLSNLVCFFNQTCINDLTAVINFTGDIATSALDPSKLIYFNVTSTIESMMEKIMVEQWSRNVSYINYYTQCQPVYCKYTYEQQNDVIYIITTLIALVGGLTSILQLIVPRFVKLVRKFLLKRKQRRTGVVNAF